MTVVVSVDLWTNPEIFATRKKGARADDGCKISTATASALQLLFTLLVITPTVVERLGFVEYNPYYIPSPPLRSGYKVNYSFCVCYHQQYPEQENIT
jgi:hypothetical protein